MFHQSSRTVRCRRVPSCCRSGGRFLLGALRGLSFSLLVGLLMTGTASAAEDPRPIMHEVVDALAYLLPLSFDEERLGDADQAATTTQKLKTLEESASKLEAHADQRDVGFRMLSGSLAQAARRMRRYYDYSRPEDARFFLVDLTQNCVACHSRLPGGGSYPLAEQLVKRIDTPSLHPRDRAQLQVALRQFGNALTSWEELFAWPHVDPVELDVEGDLIDYLTISIRVLGDPERARAVLQKFAARDDLPTYMRAHVDRWIEDLGALGREASEAADLDKARQLFNHASGLSVLPAGRERAVYDLAASGILHRYVDSRGGERSEELAEAYYLLAIIEARTVEPRSAVPQMEFHLEAAIRSNPRSMWAKRAYAILEEYSLLNYGGLMLDKPPEELERLETLKALIN